MSRRNLLLAGATGLGTLTASAPAAESTPKPLRIGLLSASIHGKPQPRNGHAWHFRQYLHPNIVEQKSQMSLPNPITIRHAVAADIPALVALLYDHGANEWNHLPEGPITAHLNRIADGTAQAVIAEFRGELVGFVSSEIGLGMARYQADDRKAEPHGIIHEAVVHRDCVGQGIGSRLLSAAVERLGQLGSREVYVGRHDENLGSAGMMRKAGFEVIDVFDDPRRTSGNRRTAISRFIIRD